MTIRDIITLPNEKLREISKPVTAFDESLRTLIQDMFETMYAAPGIGLAAIQIGIPLRVVIMDVSREEQPKHPFTLINPEIIWQSEETLPYEEGCLSIPEMTAEISRPESIKLKAFNVSGEPFEMEMDGLQATCAQHEIDHLNGKLFIDHLSRLKRERLLKKYSKQESEAE